MLCSPVSKLRLGDCKPNPSLIHAEQAFYNWPLVRNSDYLDSRQAVYCVNKCRLNCF